MENVLIRPASPEDAPSILWMIQLIAEYEKEPYEPKLTRKEFLRDGFGEEKYFSALVVELKTGIPLVEEERRNSSTEMPSSSMERNERLIGYVLYFSRYSSWRGRMLHIEDLFVKEPYRGNGIGSQLMKECAKVAMSRGCHRMSWEVLDWNVDAIRLYKKIGGTLVHDWLCVRLVEDDLKRFAAAETNQTGTMLADVMIREANAADVPSLLWLIQLDSEHHEEPHEVVIGEKELLGDGFGEEKYFSALVVELKPGISPVEEAVSQDFPSSRLKPNSNQRIVGHAIYYHRYSTWKGRVLHVAGLFVREPYRGKGIGIQLMRECAKIAVAKDCPRMCWEVKKANSTALKFYYKIGSTCLPEWVIVRLVGEALSAFANS